MKRHQPARAPSRRKIRAAFVTAIAAVAILAAQGAHAAFSIATFEADATPPIGAPLCGGGVEPAKEITDPLSARGIVFFPEGEAPIVLCAVDWVGIGNGGHRAWREALADAAGTPVTRVSVHVLHQHDAPMCDFTVEEMIAPHGLGGVTMDVDSARETIARTAAALRESLPNRQPVTHIGAGEAVVRHVASNRRILDENGKVRVMRFTATRDPEVRAEPVGTIDPFLKSVTFWNEDTALAVLTYYATHPQSHYGKGYVTADFPGMARSAREAALPGVPHIHFNGAGGNLGAGKWNDGSPENRPVLAARLEEGMRKAFETSRKEPAGDHALEWAVERVVMPARDEVSPEHESARLESPDTPAGQRVRAARELAWINRNNADTPIEVSRLRIGDLQLIHLPGELFVEYQIAAQDMAPENLVCVAAYGDYGPGYIGTCVAYDEGGYETQVNTARCGPAVEAVLTDAMRALLQ